MITPDAYREPLNTGKVLAVGRGLALPSGEYVALNLKAGDRVMFGKMAGQAVTLDGEELLMLTGDDIVGVVVGE